MRRGWGWEIKSTAPSQAWGLRSTLTSFMVVLFCSQRHSITLILLQGVKGERRRGGKGGGGRGTCPRARQVPAVLSRAVLSALAPPASPAPAAVSPPPRGRCCARGPYPGAGARAARLPRLARSLPAGLPASAKSNNSPCGRAPAPRSAEAAGAAAAGGSGQPAPRPLRRPAGGSAWPPALQWAGSSPRGAAGRARKGLRGVVLNFQGGRG